ncbi:MAG: hypothetical protein QOG62_308 [Thermoleophilaceae bacterium]|nr:hypothetical protein [Thermoleophilaceae bacterium]
MSRELPLIGAELGGYRLTSALSRGGMAVVYLAEDMRLGRTVVLKILAPELAEDDNFRSRFLRESRIAASIDHPNVIPIYDAGEADGLLYIAMRHVQDADLRGLLRLEAPLDVKRSISIVSQIASALEAAHRRDLVHRDVKPANVLMITRRSFDSADHIYLSDFGLAKRSSSVSGLTATGKFLGTVSYSAPEQVEGLPVDARTDIYALGCVLFECLTRRPPFKKEEDMAVLMAHIRDVPARVTDLRPDCPPELADIVARTLEKSPDDRFQTCDEMMDAMRAVDTGTSSRSVSMPALTDPDETLAPGSGAPPAIPPVAEEPAQAAPPPPPPVEPPPAPPYGGPVEPPPPAPPVQPPAASTPPGGPGPGRKRIGIAIAAGVAALVVGFAAVHFLLGGNSGEVPGSTAPAISRTAPDTEASWRTIRDSPTARQQAAAAALDGRVWILGGLTGKTNATTATASTEAYDPAINTWTTGPDLPVPLHHPMAVTYHGELVVMGGWIPEGANLTAKTSNRVFALRNGSWVELPPMNNARAAGAAAVADDRIVVVGGQADEQLVAPTEVFDGKSWREVADIPTPREHLAAAADGGAGSVYAVGGRELSADKNSAALERYDPERNQWVKLPNMPIPAGSIGAAVVQGQLVVVGGETPTTVLKDVQSFDLTTEKWSVLPNMIAARHGMGVVGIGNTLYVIDGALAPTHAQSTATGEALDFK